jgi:hypothetical protein
LALDLFQRAALGFGKFPPDEYEAQGADGGVKPEGVAGADGAFEPGKCVSQDETRDPEGGDGRGNRRAPDAVGKVSGITPPPRRRAAPSILLTQVRRAAGAGFRLAPQRVAQ